MSPFIPHTSGKGFGGGNQLNPLRAPAMFRNLIVGAFFGPLGALLPIAVLALAVAIISAPFSGNPILVLTTVLVQLGYGLFAVYWFGWIAALLIGLGNGIVWRFTRSIPRRLVLSPAVGVAAIALSFGWMLLSGGLSALPSFALFCLGGICAAIFSAFLVALGDVPPLEDAAA